MEGRLFGAKKYKSIEEKPAAYEASRKEAAGQLFLCPRVHPLPLIFTSTSSSSSSFHRLLGCFGSLKDKKGVHIRSLPLEKKMAFSDKGARVGPLPKERGGTCVHACARLTCFSGLLILSRRRKMPTCPIAFSFPFFFFFFFFFLLILSNSQLLFFYIFFFFFLSCLLVVFPSKAVWNCRGSMPVFY